MSNVKPGKLGHTYEMNGHVFIAQKPCTSNRGNWLCASCDEAFQNQMQKDSHINDDRQHVLLWNCHTHGVEIPSNPKDPQ